MRHSRSRRRAGHPDTAVPLVLFTRVRAAASHGVVGIMRSLGRLGVAVYWSVPEPLPPAAYSRYVTRNFPCGVGASQEEVLEHLTAVRRSLGTQPILVATDDLAARFVEDNTASLRGSFIFPEQPPRLARRLSDKKELYGLCKELGVPTAETSFPRSREELVSVAETTSYPVVFKGIDTTLAGEHTGFRMVIVTDHDELLSAYDALESAEEPEFMVQEYIPGPPESNWMLNGYFDAQSECRFALCGRKLRQSPPYTGAATLGVCLENAAVKDATISLMKKLGYRGILDIGYRFDARDGQYKLLDPNPRIGSTFRLFVDSNGLDAIRALYFDLTGTPWLPGSTRSGRRWLVETSDLTSAPVYIRDGLLSPRSWLASLRGVEEVAWFAKDDPAPAARAYAKAVWKRLPLRQASRDGASPSTLGFRPSFPGASHTRSRPLACCMVSSGDMDLVRALGLADIDCAVVAPRSNRIRFSRFTRVAIDSTAGGLLRRLVAFGQAQPYPPVLFYESDWSLRFIAENREQLAQVYRFVMPSNDVVYALLDKGLFNDLAAKRGLPVPPARRFRPADEPLPDDLGMSFPVVVKAVPFRDGAWAKLDSDSKVLRVESPEQLRRLWPRLAEAGLDILVQELVVGPESRIESYHVYVDQQGEVAGEFTGRKIRTYPPEFGFTTSLVTTRAADVIALGRAVVDRLELRGVAKLDLKRGPDGRLRLLEVNPRFSLWNHIGALAGVNIPALVYADLVGEPRPPVAPARPGLTWYRPVKDGAAAMAQGESLSRWLRWAYTCDANSALSLDDPMPLLVGKVWSKVDARIQRRTARPEAR